MTLLCGRELSTKKVNNVAIALFLVAFLFSVLAAALPGWSTLTWKWSATCTARATWGPWRERFTRCTSGGSLGGNSTYDDEDDTSYDFFELGFEDYGSSYSLNQLTTILGCVTAFVGFFYKCSYRASNQAFTSTVKGRAITFAKVILLVGLAEMVCAFYWVGYWNDQLAMDPEPFIEYAACTAGCALAITASFVLVVAAYLVLIIAHAGAEVSLNNLPGSQGAQCGPVANNRPGSQAEASSLGTTNPPVIVRGVEVTNPTLSSAEAGVIRSVEMTNPPQAAGSSASTAGGGRDTDNVVSKLQGLTELYQQGHLSDDEFKAFKAKVLSGAGDPNVA